ncbi:hypothetical protein BU16DRAFT_591324 [Lophium mytilinum]|uniref:SRR1-like domain-containing protein n=1 Tax=Lophium mytilinum TaxID=390894 RepID=A0A6A6QPI7_9PEZI|nr:hypothetical protein BU16DRAFT_591324 [Lophium mytilinum]
MKMSEEATRLLETYQKEWRSSRFSYAIKTQLKDVVKNQVEPIDNAVLLGLGCYRFQDDEHEGHRPFLGQLVIFLDLVKYLSNIQAQVHPRKTVTMFAADPSFEKIDEAILEHYNIKVLPHAANYRKHVGSSTFVFSAYAYHVIEAGVVRQRPGLYLGTDCKKRFDFYDQQVDYPGATDNDGRLQAMQGKASFKKFMKHSSEIKFPDASGTPWWRSVSGLCFYWPKPVAVVEPEVEFQEHQKAWKASQFSVDLRNLLQARPGAIETAVLLGMGSVKGLAGPGWQAKRMYQLVIFLDIVDKLSRAQSDMKIKMIASDPAFNDIDKKLLKGLDIEVVDRSSPTSNYEDEWNVGPSTFVFAAGVPFDVDLDVASRNPGLYLGPDWAGRLDFCHLSDQKIKGKVYEDLLHGSTEEIFPSAINRIDKTKAPPEGWEELQRLTLGAVDSMCFYWPKKFSTEEQAALPVLGEHYSMPFIRCQNAWNSSRFRGELRALLAKEFKHAGSIDTAILLGVGSISAAHRKGQYNKTSVLNQLVIFLDIVEYLSDARGGRSIKVLASEPNFHDIDKKMLQDLGIQILPENEWESECGPSSFVFAAKLPFFIDVKVVSKNPGLYLGPSKEARQAGVATANCREVYEDFFQWRIESFFPSAERYGQASVPEGWRDLKKLTAGAVIWMAFYWPEIEALDKVRFSLEQFLVW